ncbi:FYVE and coiled-coil domain-containing protein 1 isoform X2 [Pelobates fuscus]|uniref:FYVE and coiled-coil domain-containing protein 1 isoform X2 n=1 Tax=Pelobates fuscus TaxID=191477 RepID=UPI002FE47ED3
MRSEKANPTLILTMALTMGESQLQRIIKDLQDAVSELGKEFKEMGDPITDDSTNLHKFFYRLEYLLQFDLKEKSTLLGNKKDYWDYFCDCLAKVKGANDGIRFVKSTPELKTSLGKGRAFLRYSLVHQRLADTLQQCFMNDGVTRDWYYARSPFLKSKTCLEIVGYLYELTEVQFDLASRGYDLDASWPMFARRTVMSSGSSSYLWRSPSRSSSMSSLLSTNFQNQEFPSNLEPNNSLNVEPLDSLDEMRIELDETERRTRELESHVKQLVKENQDLHNSLQLQLEMSKEEREANNSIVKGTEYLIKMIKELQQQHAFSQSTLSIVQELQMCLSTFKSGEREREKRKPQKGCPKEIMQLQSPLQELEEYNTSVSASNANDVHDVQGNSDLSEQYNSIIPRKKCFFKDESNKDIYFQNEQRFQTDNALENIHEYRHENQTLSTFKENLKKSEGKYESNVQGHTKHLTVMEVMDSLLKSDFETAPPVFEEDRDFLLKRIASLESSLAEVLEEYKKLNEECSLKEETHQQNDKIKTQQLHILEQQLTEMSQTLCVNKKENSLLTEDRNLLARTIENLEEQTTKQNLLIKDLTEKNNNLLFHNKKLNEAEAVLQHENTKLQQTLHLLEAQKEAFCESEKSLRNLLDTALVSVDEKEKKVLELNKEFDESLHIYRKLCLEKDEKYNTLENCFKEMQGQEQEKKSYFSLLQTEHNNAIVLIEQLEKSIASLKEKSLNVELHNKCMCQEAVDKFYDLANKMEICAKQSHKIDESVMVEKSNLEQKSPLEKNAEDITNRMTMIEKQLQLSFDEMKRLQKETREDRVMLNRTNEDKVSALEKLAVTEAMLSENQSQVQQLKKHIEQLNVGHMEEVMKFNEREERLIEEKEKMSIQKSHLEEKYSCMKVEFAQVEKQAEKTRVEHSETKEKLKNANADITTLNAQCFSLTKENGNLYSDIAALELSKLALEEKLKNHEASLSTVMVLQEKLLETENKLKSTHGSSQEEISTMKFHYSTEILNYQTRVKAITEECESLKQQLEKEKHIHLELQQEISRIENVESEQNKKLTDELKIRTDFESIITKYEENAKILMESLARKEDELETANKEAKEQFRELCNIKKEKESNEQKMIANIDDLNKTKQYLEERLIELISLCGRIFCYYCCNNYVMTKHSGKKERCCQACYKKDEISNACDSGDSTRQEAPATAGKRGVTVTEESKDTVFDIITDEELDHVLNSTSLSEDQNSLEQYTPDLNSSSTSLATDDSEDIQIAQDNEIHLLTTGELMLKVPLTVEEVMNFGESNRELFIKSGTYSIIPITVTQPGLTITWIFSSDTKSITFSVVYQETESAPLDQCKVLIPMIRCNSHKESIQGELKVRNPGIYSLIFDNTFSRFISKRVFYRLGVEQPVVYDGSDLP